VRLRVGDRKTGPHPKEKRFPAGTAVRVMKRWQEDQRAELRRRRTTLNQMEPTATKGFLMIMAFCGFRPEEIRRTELWMVRLDAETPHVIRNTAKGGDVTVVPLSDEGVLAWRMFIEHGGLAWQRRQLVDRVPVRVWSGGLRSQRPLVRIQPGAPLYSKICDSYPHLCS
jgi:hypothetical protein